MPMICRICPRNCRVLRKDSLSSKEGRLGACGMGRLPVLARAGLHHWEEPCISGARGSGAVFFSGCSLNCCFCQNYQISSERHGTEISVARLREIYRELIAQGAHNINLVNPSHFLDAVLDSLDPPPPVPVVYNSSGYEKVESLRRLEGRVQVYLPDLKYSDGACALRYSGAPDYFETATAAIEEMFRQTGPYRLGEDGLLQRGVVIRHLILPSRPDNSFGVIDWVAERFQPGDVLFSLMRQYIPCGRAADFPEINRTLTAEEYGRVERYLLYTGIEDGFLQEDSSASDAFVPAFDLTGVGGEEPKALQPDCGV